MVNFHYINKDLYHTSQFSSLNQHDNLDHDDLYCTKHLNSIINDNTKWDLLRSIELNDENIKSVSNLYALDQLSTLSNNNDNNYKSLKIDDTTTIDSWTPSIDQSFIHREILINKMKNWKLYRNTSPLNYFNNMNNTSNIDNLPEKYSVQCRFRTFEDVPKDQIDDHVATVHIFNRYLMNNEYEHGDQLQTLKDVHSSVDLSENLTEQFITPSISDGVTLDVCNQELRSMQHKSSNNNLHIIIVLSKLIKTD
ncbi:unnamed protein product [Schistosoma margrebowiei]|uniref:Uncharacterized protein n=1 Tax=Schistosoma margrebowiei TaxID=48269 RepID=A0A183LK47_9TREM|nr:unnamed protein product [Schistosoma margrebowiei]